MAAAKKAAADPRDVLAKNREDSEKLAKVLGNKRLRHILEKANVQLAQRLVQAESLSGPGKDSFTAAQLKATLAQVVQVTRHVAHGMGETVLEQGRDASVMSVEHFAEYMRAADKQFRGVGTQPLALNTAGMLDAVSQGVEASLLRRLGTDPDEGGKGTEPQRAGILERYGISAVGKFEEVLQVGLVARTPWAEMRARLIGESPFLQGAPAFWAERIVRTECLLGETQVSGAVVRAVFRRWYEGPVVEVITDGGRKFTTTPNHPMLTRRAWVHTGELREGDHLVCYRGQENAGAPRDEHVHNGPATIREIFDATATVSIGERRRTTQPDFHGDGRDGEVDVFRPSRVLRVGHFAPLYEPLTERVFSPSGVLRARFCRACRRLLSIQEQACGCRTAARDASLFQAARDCASSGAEFVRERFRAFSALVAGDDILARQFELAGVSKSSEAIRRCFTPGPSQREFAERVLQTIRADAGSTGRAFGARSCDVEFDRVREVRVREFSGHVFNLETPHGYFAINGAYTGNTMGAYNRGGWEANRAADDELGDMVKILAATFDDRTGYDSFQVHGQIRRPEEAFEWSGGFFAHPPNRPNDREVVVSHRIAWPIPPYLAWRDPAEAMAAWVRAGRKGGMPAGPAQMTTVPLERFGKSQAPE